MSLRIVVTAGPTREHIDPVRFISNPSTGRMGFAVAAAAARRGHDVTLIAGPVSLPTPKGVKRVDVVSARDMLAAVQNEIEARNPGAKNCASPVFLVSTAAVADWRPKAMSATKLKKSQMTGVLELERNPDILKTVGGCRKIGFAAETGDAVAEGRRKCREKGLELIVANDVTEEGAGFGVRTNRVAFITPDGGVTRLPLLSKAAIGTRIVKFCESLLKFESLKV